MTAEEMAGAVARAHDGSEAKWTEIDQVRQCYLEMHAHFIRQKEDLAITVDELADLEALYDALLGVRPRRRGGTPAPTAGPAEAAGGARPRRQGRPRKEAPKPAAPAQEPGEEAARPPDLEGP